MEFLSIFRGSGKPISRDKTNILFVINDEIYLIIEEIGKIC